MLKINDLITSGESMSVRRPKRRSTFFESASIIVQGKELNSRWDTFNLTRFMTASEAGPNSPYGKNNAGYSKDAFSGSDQKTTKEKPTGIWAKAKTLAKNTWEWIKRVFKRFREWLADTWKKIKEWFGKTFKKNKKDASPEAKKTADKMENAAETVNTAAANPTVENIKEATTVIEEVVEVMEAEDAEVVTEATVITPEFVKAADAMAATVIKEAEKVTSGGDVADAQEKVEAVKAAATAVTNIQKTVTKKMAESTRRRKGMRGAGQVPGSEFEVKKGNARKQTKRTVQWMTK